VVHEKKDDERRKLKCFRCQEIGHHQKDCSNELICFKCKEPGHMATECLEIHSRSSELRMFGFAVPDQGFYSIIVSGEHDQQKAACIIQVLQGEASECKLEEELKNLINEQWDWQVRKVENKEYTTIFPDKVSLETFSKISEILLSIHGIKIKILKSNIDPDAVEVL
jgi:hypothetical protein